MIVYDDVGVCPPIARHTYPLYDFEGDDYYVHSPCACNEMISLCNRHMLARTIEQKKPLPSYDFQIRLVPDTAWQIVRKYTAFNRRKMINALYNVRQFGISRYHARVSLFLKNEKILDPGKPPRAIQYRSPEYNLELSRYLAPFERAMYEFSETNKYPCFAKGKTAYQRGLLLELKFDKFVNPYIYQVDYSKFDAHVTVDHLKAEHDCYLRAYDGDRYLAWLLKLQLRNYGRSSNGIRYIVDGKRMSGDVNTGLGNSLINFLVLRQVAPSAEYLIDGDDCLVISDKPIEFSSDYGFDFKVCLHRQLLGVKFCSSYYLPTLGRFIRDPYVIISKHSHTIRKLIGQANAGLLRAIGECELACCTGVPMIQDFALLLISCAPKALFDPELLFKAAGLPVQISPILDETRVEFYMVFGYEPYYQVAFEQSLKTPQSEVLPLFHVAGSTGSTIRQCEEQEERGPHGHLTVAHEWLAYRDQLDASATRQPPKPPLYWEAF